MWYQSCIARANWKINLLRSILGNNCWYAMKSWKFYRFLVFQLSVLKRLRILKIWRFRDKKLISLQDESKPHYWNIKLVGNITSDITGAFGFRRDCEGAKGFLCSSNNCSSYKDYPIKVAHQPSNILNLVFPFASLTQPSGKISPEGLSWEVLHASSLFRTPFRTLTRVCNYCRIVLCEKQPRHRQREITIWTVSFNCVILYCG